MGNIVEFPSLASRAWAEWEREIRSAANGRGLSDEVVMDALPRLRAHWEAIFEAVQLELPERPVPGELTKQQAKAIQRLIDDAAGVVMARLRHERAVAFQRFVLVELALSHSWLQQPPTRAH
jgi:hypothetical protein